MERRPDLGPHPASEQDPDGFEVLWAADSGPLPRDIARDLESLSDALRPVVPTEDGVIGTRFGRRTIVAPVQNPEDAVDVADVDVSRSVVFTMGGEDPTPAGTLLAKVLSLRGDVLYGYAEAEEIDGPTMDVLQQLLPALRGGLAARIDGTGGVALGRHPEELRGAVEQILQDPDEEDGEAAGSEDAPSVNR